MVIASVYICFNYYNSLYCYWFGTILGTVRSEVQILKITFWKLWEHIYHFRGLWYKISWIMLKQVRQTLFLMPRFYAREMLGFPIPSTLFLTKLNLFRTYTRVAGISSSHFQQFGSRSGSNSFEASGCMLHFVWSWVD